LLLSTLVGSGIAISKAKSKKDFKGMLSKILSMSVALVIGYLVIAYWVVPLAIIIGSSLIVYGVTLVLLVGILALSSMFTDLFGKQNKP
jgi:hypothetical protein